MLPNAEVLDCPVTLRLLVASTVIVPTAVAAAATSSVSWLTKKLTTVIKLKEPNHQYQPDPMDLQL